MFWLFAIIIFILICCIPLDDENFEINRHINKLADESRRRDSIYKPRNRPWLG